MYGAARLFAPDVRRRVAESYGPFDRPTAGMRVCRSGYCVMGALAREVGLRDWWAKAPAPDTLAEVMDQRGLLPAGIDRRRATRLIARATRANDGGRLDTPEAVRRFLGVA